MFYPKKSKETVFHDARSILQIRSQHTIPTPKQKINTDQEINVRRDQGKQPYSPVALRKRSFVLPTGIGLYNWEYQKDQ